MPHADLESAVTRQSWEWLFDLPHRLNLVIEVVNARYLPVFPAAPTAEAATIRRLLRSGEPSIRAALEASLHSPTPVQVTVEDVLALSFKLAAGGMLLLARTLNADDSPAECREDLELIGSWLTGAIDASLTKPANAISVEPYRMVSFQRILRDATSRGSIRKVVGAFVESLSVWEDVRIGCYVTSVTGGLFQYASPVMAPSTSFPARLDEAVVPQNRRIVRLSRADVDRLGLTSEPGDVLMLRIPTGPDISWTLLFVGMIDDREQVRLTVYADMLREALNELLATAINRLVADVTRHHLPQDEPLQTAAQTVLAQLTAAVGGQQSALAVSRANGGQALAVGNTALLSSDPARHDRLVARSSDGDSLMTLVIAREPGPFAAFEREIVRAGVAAVHPWMQAALQCTKETERRRSFRSVDTVFEELAAGAVAAGQPASVIVISVDPTMLRPSLISSWVGRIRAEIRGGDFAGTLSDREIAILLCDASADQAAVVCARLQQMLAVDDTTGMFHTAIGITTRSPDSPFEGSLVGAARAGAAAIH
ncbi:MAG TPA: hypothetical protein VI485_16335 [Vicinamibacterales bacterium]|nr:hypothetical protein [Vicinamibacterales bacterium]